MSRAAEKLNFVYGCAGSIDRQLLAEFGVDPTGESTQASLGDAVVACVTVHGLKPTPTFVESLRDSAHLDGGAERQNLLKEAGKGIGEVREFVTFDSRFPDAQGFGGDFEFAELARKPDVVYDPSQR